MPIQRLSVTELANKLNEVRAQNTKNSKYEEEVPECQCVLGRGCSCGRFQYDKKWSEREKRLDWASRSWPLSPKEGREYLISRAPGTSANYADIDFWYWAQLEGMIVKNHKIEQDKNDPDTFWVCFEVSKHTRLEYPDWIWVPNDSLIEV